MKINYLVVILVLLVGMLAGCATMKGFVGDGGVGLQLTEPKAKPVGYTLDTTSRFFPDENTTPTDKSWNIF